MKKLLVLDSNSIINRAFYGIRTLNAPDGTPTNGIYGFINILTKLISDHKPDYILAAFDLKAPTFRHKMYDGYKATRHGMPDELAVQMPLMKDILTQMNIPILQIEGYEADDIIGTVSRICGEKNIECFIATGDKDDLQLADNGTTVVLASTKMGQSITELFDEKAVLDKYGVTPEQFVDLKALMGDKSDNIPGVMGIGEKTASKLISQFASIENMYDNIDDAEVTPRIKQKLKDGYDDAVLSKKLARIDVNVPIDIQLENGSNAMKSFKPELYTTLMRLGLKSQVKKLNLTPVESNPDAEENADFFSDKLIVTDSKPSVMTSPVSVYFSVINNEISAVGLSDGKQSYLTTLDDAKEILEDESIVKYTIDLKSCLKAVNGICSLNSFDFDCMIAAYLDNPANALDIDSLAAHYLGVYITDSQKNAQLSLFDDETAENDIPAKYALIISALQKVLSEKIEQNNQHKLYYEVEHPLIYVLADMENIGFTLDTTELKKFGDMLRSRMDKLEETIYEEAGEKFNVNSPKQLSVILFEKLGLKGGKKTKSGYSTKADILEKLAPDNKIVADVLEYRSYQKLKSTYCDSFAALVNPSTGRIHSVFHQTGTVTGRLSSSDPNLQNIPTRTELGRELRKMFTASEGNILVDADYSQIELRVLAHLSGDAAMTEAFNSGADIHAVTASKILGVPINELTKEQRSSAKAINFGIVYGMSEYTLSQDLGISFKQAKNYMDEYFNKYSGVREYLDKLKSDAHKNGYVTTLMNRIRYISELNSSNANLRGYGERIAMNTPVQGTAADIIKLAMVRVYNRLKSEKLKARLILQVHDELIIETPENEVETVKKLLTEEMENTIHISVPLSAEASEGKSWYDAK